MNKALSTSPAATISRSGTAVVAFLGDLRREAREKNLPARFLSAVHRHVAQSVRALPDADLLIATHAAGRFEITRNGVFLSVAASTLAEQLDHAVRSCFEAGYERVLLLAGDIADSPASEIRAAIAALDSRRPRMAMGRSSDGGFYLVGFNAAPCIDWERVSWHTATVADEMAQLARAAGFEEVPLLPLDDIDSLSEAWRLLSRPSRSARVRRLRLALRSILLETQSATPRVLRCPLASPRAIISLRAPPVTAA